jgi:hypothetical protein
VQRHVLALEEGVQRRVTAADLAACLRVLAALEQEAARRTATR